MDILRFATAGSVDDGKSTLIGRLLYDSKSIFADQLEAVERTSRDRGEDYTNLALLTDGLRAEREQGTRSTSPTGTSRRRGGSSSSPTPPATSSTPATWSPGLTADLAVVLVDARNGLTEQSRRHAFPHHAARVPHMVLAVNKMDLVDYSAEVFEKILRGVLRLRDPAGHRRPDLHPDLRAARRQRGGPFGQHAVVRRALAGCTTWSTCTSRRTAT